MKLTIDLSARYICTYLGTGYGEPTYAPVIRSVYENMYLQVDRLRPLRFTLESFGWPSERLLGLLIPQKGEPLVICPAFEQAASANNSASRPKSVSGRRMRVSTRLEASALADRGLRTGRIVGEEAAMFTVYDHLRQRLASNSLPPIPSPSPVAALSRPTNAN
jgi:hypothetical protein